VTDGCVRDFCAEACTYFPGILAVVQQESIWPLAANGQSARRQQSTSFAFAKRRFTQSPVFTRRIANPSMMLIGLNTRIGLYSCLRTLAKSSPVITARYK